MEKQEFLNRYIVNRKGTDSMKWDGLTEKFGEADLTAMWIADMEFRTCDAITDAMIEMWPRCIWIFERAARLLPVFSDWMERRYHFPIKKEWVRFSTGCVTGIAWMIHAFTKPRDACMILTPVYYPFYNVVTNNDRTLVKVPLDYADGYFTMNYEAIEKAIVEKDVKMFIQCSPHNPAGRVWNEAELDHVLSICQKHHVLVVSDEIHQDLVLGERQFVPAAVVSEGKYRDMILTLSSASKTFNLATLLHSHIVITNSQLMEAYDKFASGLNRTEVSIMGMIATKAGYAGGEEWLNNLLEVIQDNYGYLKRELNEKLPEVTVCALEGTYLVLLDLRKIVEPEKTQEFVQKKCRLAVDYGEWFAEGYQGFIRMNLATDPAYVKEAVKSLLAAAGKE